MFGLEKDKKSFKRFEFDLEKTIEEDPEEFNNLIDNIAKKEAIILKQLKEASKEEMDNYDILLRGYRALTKVIKTTKKDKR